MHEEQTALLSRVLSTESRRSVNPEGIEAFSPALAVQSPTLGNGAMKLSTLKGLNGVATAAGAGDATPLGLGIIILGDDYPG